MVRRWWGGGRRRILLVPLAMLATGLLASVAVWRFLMRDADSSASLRVVRGEPLPSDDRWALAGLAAEQARR